MDLNSTDIYSDSLIPDADVEACLKVLRTIHGILGKMNKTPTFDPTPSMKILHLGHTIVKDIISQATRVDEKK